MRLCVFGLTISSSWGNGHATLWRGLCRALSEQGHHVTFFERDVPYYAGARDCTEIPGGKLVLYPNWDEVAPRAKRAIETADAAIITSYCPDALSAATLLVDSSCVRVFYDMDTPVTLGRLTRGEDVGYIGPQGLSEYDLVLSYTGGRALDVLRDELGARRVTPLYGHADPHVYRRVAANQRYQCDLSYLGTYAADRQAALEALFVRPAQARPDLRFLIGGAQYPESFPWSENIFFVRHLPPSEHPAFYSSSRATLNITRRDMAAMGWCPSGRLFEAALCGAPLISDSWEGLDTFFSPEEEIIVAQCEGDVLAALQSPEGELMRMAARARDRVLAQHTSDHRARELISLLSDFTAETRTNSAAEIRL